MLSFLLDLAQVQRLLLTRDITKPDLLSLSNPSLGTSSLRAFFSHFGQRAIHKTARSKQARPHSNRIEALSLDPLLPHRVLVVP